jgi:uncharacterized protein YjiK
MILFIGDLHSQIIKVLSFIMIPKIVLVISLVISFSHSQNAKPSNAVGYDLAKPDQIFVLPNILQEISGVTAVDSTSLASVQDELGILFIYNVSKKEITKQYHFAGDGDYEGITRVGKIIYVLRSDGVLFEIPDYQSGAFQAVSYSLHIPSKDNEGLCYDRNNNRLLIANKSKIGKGKVLKDLRAIYGFDLCTKRLTKEPVMSFHLSDVKQFAHDNSISLPKQVKKNGRDINPSLRLKISAIGIHPLTNKLYVLSAVDLLLLILEMNGTIEHMEMLDPQLFNKAEGITFLENGDMFISNESGKQQPTILRFNYRKK